MKYNHVYTRYVLIEKFTVDFAFKIQLHNALVISRQNRNVMSDVFINLVSEMIKTELVKPRFQNITIETCGELFHAAFASCLKGFKNYKDNGDIQKCYKYFKTVIYHGFFYQI